MINWVRSDRRRPLLLLGLPVALLAGGCGASDDAAPPGLALADAKGCTSCHGSEGDGGVAPSWAGIAGEAVELADGSSVVRDREYLKRSITDPQAQQVAGYSLAMPTVALTAAEVDTLVAYLEELE